MEPPVSRIGWDEQKIEDVRMEVRRATNIMKSNVQKMMERNEKLDDLVERAQRLELAANEYDKSAIRVKRHVDWKVLAKRYCVVAASAILALSGLAYSFM